MNRNEYVPSALADVSAAPANGVVVDGGDGRWTLVFVRDFRHAPDVVWVALTDPAQLAAWAPFIADRDLASTGPATLTMVDGESETRLAASVIRADRPSLLEYQWGDDLLRWALTPTDAGTRMTLHHTTAQRSAVPMMAAGWHLCLDVMAHLLCGDPIGPIRGAEAHEFGWQRLHESYADRLGINVAQS
jgi:uncharacterized protein YndB with AHSA1/START domain